FDPKINCIVGNNGVGKTNVLDSIYHLAFGRSYFNPVTSQNINHEAECFVIDGHLEKKQREEHIVVSAKRAQKRVIKRNNKPYEKFSEHTGFVPTGIIPPADSDLISEGSETRRKSLDSGSSQNDPVYRTSRINYGKILS